MSDLQEIRIRYVHFGDFRKSEPTLLEEVLKIAKDLKLGKNDCVLMMSGNRKVLRFVFGFRDLEILGRGGIDMQRATRMIVSRTYRVVDGGTFNPYMLRNYAEDIGLSPTALKRYEEALKDEEDAKRRGSYRAAA